MARQERKYHYIYKITCLITNRYYIGMHSTDNLDDGYFGSGKRLWFSINYHGKNNHVKENLEFCESRNELKEREKEIVTKELIGEDLCMNLKEGGDGGGKIWSEEHHEKLKLGASKWNKIRWQNKEFKEKMCELSGKRMTEHHKAGKIRYDTFTGKKHTDETKKLMSEKAKTYIGNKNSQYGTCWITKEGINKKIKKENLDEYIKEGWISGRIFK